MNFISRMISWYKRPKSKTADFYESLVLIIPLVFLIRTIGFGLYQVPTGSMETTMLVGERFFADKFTILFSPAKHGEVISFNDPNFGYADNKLKFWFQMYVWGPSNWTKRVIGEPGDHIQGVIEDGKPVVYRNNKKLDEPYLNSYPLIATFNPERSRQLIFKSYVSNVPLDQQPWYRMSAFETMNGRKLAGSEAMLYPNTPVIYHRGLPDEKCVDVFDVHLGSDEYWAMGDNRQGSYDSRFWGPLKKHLIHGKIVLCLYSIDIDETWGMFEILHIFPFDLLLHPIDFWTRVRWSRCLHLVH